MKVSFLPNFPACHAVLLLFSIPAALLAGPTPAAPETAPDKSGYHLFNPTPRDQMRDLNTDRPDQTEGPFTVDAGHIQLEMDFFTLTYDRHSPDGTRSETWNVAPINARIGLCNRVELDLILDNYVNVRTREGRVTDRTSGFGDITTRLKINFWGNDGGTTAFGIIPFVKLPLDASNLRNGRTEGGVILPFNISLPGGWGVGMMTEADFVSDDRGGYDTEWVNSISVSRNLTKQLGAYVEFFSVVGTAPGFDWQGQADVGVTFAVTDNLQLDCGCNFGLTKSAPDFQPFAGISVRF
jgi:hypothetical protein